MKSKKKCPKCSKSKPADKFYPDYGRNGGISKWCIDCRRESCKKYYWDNRERSLERSKTYGKTHREELKEYHREYYKNNKDWWIEWRIKNKDHKRDTDLKRRRRLALEVIAAYGGECSCCGESRTRFLTIEHINHDGKAHREMVSSLYMDLKKRGWPKEGLTLYCWNCQMATRYGDPCPHKEVINERSIRA